MISLFMNSPLFLGMTEVEADKCLKCLNAQVKTYQKNEIIFEQLTKPNSLYVIGEGAVAICKDLISGKRSIVTTLEQSGEIFGEVYVFLENQNYDYYSLATKKVTLLEIPKSSFYHHCENNCNAHVKLTQNMLGILAEKAYYLNKKLQLLANGSLREKLAKYILDNIDEDKNVIMKMNREEFSNFLNVARPSLSRELTKMRDEGLICIKGKNISVCNLVALESYL